MLFNSETLGLLSQEMGWQFFLHSSLLLLALHKSKFLSQHCKEDFTPSASKDTLSTVTYKNLLFFLDRHEALVIFPAHSFDTLHNTAHTRVVPVLNLPLSPFSLPTVYGQISSSLMLFRHLSYVRPNTTPS